MSAFQIASLLLVAGLGSAVALVRTPQCQVIAASLFGLVLAIMFAVFQAPDVALSQLVIGAVALPLMVLLTLVQLEEQER